MFRVPLGVLVLTVRGFTVLTVPTLGRDTASVNYYSCQRKGEGWGTGGQDGDAQNNDRIVRHLMLSNWVFLKKSGKFRDLQLIDLILLR